MPQFTRREVCVAGLSGLLLSAFGVAIARAAEGEKSVVRLASTKAAARLDPHIDVKWEVLMVLSAVYDTLVYQDKAGKIVPGLATAWQVSDDGLRYEFDLREGVSFHDGTPFNAAAVKFNFDRINAIGPKSQKAASLIADVSGVEVLAPTKVAIILKEANGGFLFNLSLTYLAMVSPAAAAQWGDEYHMHQAGTGPYKFTEYDIGEKYTLVKNPDYAWAPESFDHPGPALVDELQWRFLPEPSSRSVALLAGDFDIVFDLLPTSLSRVQASSDYDVIYSHLTGQPTYWFLNTQKAPTNDLAVRQALLHGVNMAAGVKSIMRGIAPQARGPLSHSTPEFAPQLDDLYAYDPAKAASMLDAAGWLVGADGVRQKDGQPLILEVAMASWGSSEPFSVFLQSQLKELGIRVELQMLEYAVQIQAGKKGEKNLLFTGGSGFAAGDSLMPFFFSDYADDGFAFSKFKDAKLDALMIKAKATADDAERTSLYQQAQIYIMEQALILPVYDYTVAIGVSKQMQGLDFGLVGLVTSAHGMSIAGKQG